MVAHLTVTQQSRGSNAPPQPTVNLTRSFSCGTAQHSTVGWPLRGGRGTYTSNRKSLKLGRKVCRLGLGLKNGNENTV
jgi:hypothetical protein